VSESRERKPRARPSAVARQQVVHVSVAAVLGEHADMDDRPRRLLVEGGQQDVADRPAVRVVPDVPPGLVAGRRVEQHRLRPGARADSRPVPVVVPVQRALRPPREDLEQPLAADLVQGPEAEAVRDRDRRPAVLPHVADLLLEHLEPGLLEDPPPRIEMVVHLGVQSSVDRQTVVRERGDALPDQRAADRVRILVPRQHEPEQAHLERVLRIGSDAHPRDVRPVTRGHEPPVGSRLAGIEELAHLLLEPGSGIRLDPGEATEVVRGAKPVDPKHGRTVPSPASAVNHEHADPRSRLGSR
jgi:hypothetical protein